MDSFDDYVERFNVAYAEQPHKWEATAVECNKGYEDIPIHPQDASILDDNRSVSNCEYIRIPVHAYGTVYTLDNAPEPEALAKFLDGFLCRLCAGEQFLNWSKPECDPLRHNNAIDDILAPEPVDRLLIRLPWEVEVYRDFDYAEDRLSVYGRFGVIPAWLLQ
jgi:hypothetical protein